MRAISRRRFLGGTAALAAGGAGIALVGCGDGSDARRSPTSPAPVTATPAGSAATATPARALRWTRVEAAGAPSPRRDHSLTFHAGEGVLYAFGGRAGGVSTNELWTFDPRGSRWTKVDAAGEAPAPRFGHNAFYDGQARRVVVALGQGDSGFFDDVWAFEGGRWRRLDDPSADHPEIRYGAASAHDASARRLIVSHGFTDKGRFDDTWAFSLADNRWSQVKTSGDRPIKRCLTRGLWLEAQQALAIFGGQTDSNPFLGDFWLLETARGRWAEQQVARPGARNLYGADFDASAGRWYVVSGNTPDGPVAETWVYDIRAQSWQPLMTEGEPTPRYSADAAVADGRVFLFAGHDGSAEVGDLWVLG